MCDVWFECVCGDATYLVPVDCLKWIKEKMITEFPLGEFKNVGQVPSKGG